MTTMKLTARYARYLLTSLVTMAFGWGLNYPPCTVPIRPE
jgi:hypothetical protein